MTAIYVLFGLIVLILLLLILYLYARNRGLIGFACFSRQAQRMSSLQRFNRRYGEYINLRPGTRVPHGGNYECMVCAKGGLQDSTDVLLYGKAETEQRAKTRKVTLEFYNENSVFPLCPNCGDAGGWSLLKE